MIKGLKKTWDDARKVGVLPALHAFAYRILNRLVEYRGFKVLKVTSLNADFFTLPETFQCRLLDGKELQAFVKDPLTDMTQEFVDRAFRKGDLCLGIVQSDTLASYGWYSNEPTSITTQDLEVHFPREYMYMYKAYTRPDFRGRRLHEFGMTHALRMVLGQGFQGLYSCVEANNFSSLRAFYRMGYTNVGIIHVARFNGKYLIVPAAACRKQGFELRTVPSSRPLRTAEATA